MRASPVSGGPLDGEAPRRMSAPNIIALLSVSLGTAGLAWAVIQLLEARRSSHWPRTVATVTHSWVSRHEDSEGDEMFEANVTYSYYVDGQLITADRIRVGPRTSLSWRRPAERLVAKYPVGRGVTVAYDPTDPRQGVLEPGSTKTAWVLLAISAAWIVVSLVAVRVAA